MTTNNEVDYNSFIEVYDKLAIELLKDTEPTEFVGGVMSPHEMVVRAAQLLGQEDVDLFADHKFNEAYDGTDSPRILACAFIAFMRQITFQEALNRGVGSKMFDEDMLAQSEQWHRKLMERWMSLRSGEKTKHLWLN